MNATAKKYDSAKSFALRQPAEAPRKVASWGKPSKEPRKRLRDEFEELFTFKQQTVGSDILVLRTFMRQRGMPEIAENSSVSTFATVFARFILPRRAWPFFGSSEEDRIAARKFCREWASALLPQVVEHAGPSRKAKAHKDVIPELAFLYNPVYFGLEV